MPSSKAAAAPSRDPATWTVGRDYLVFTPTHYYTGRLAIATPTELVFVNAAWIPETGRLSECLSTGPVEECEPFEDELVLPRHECKAIGWRHSLPRDLK